MEVSSNFLFHALYDTYGIKNKPISVKNPQSNAIGAYSCSLDKYVTHSWTRYGDINIFLSDAVWAICSTYHTVLQASLVAAPLGWDMLFNIPFIADWKKIGKHRRQWLTDLTLPAKTKAVLIMITKLVRKYLYRTTVSSAKQNPRPLDNHISPCKWNYHSSMQKQMWKDEYLESKTVWRINLDNE